METNDPKRDYLMKELKIPNSIFRCEVDPVTAKPYISLYLIAEDIKLMITCMDSLILAQKAVKPHALIVVALWQKVIVDYGKIFSKSKDRFSTLEVSLYFKEDQEKKLHEAIILIRNSLIAHRGDNDFEYHIMAADVVGTEENCNVLFSVPGFKSFGNYFEPVVMRRHLKQLLKKVNKQLSKKIGKLEQHVYEEMGLVPNL